MSYLSRIYKLLLSIKNPPQFLYHVCHYLNVFVPLSVAKRIQKRNRREFIKSGDFVLDTYDGSSQSVHPDLTLYKDKLWLSITPYPYGMEEYENPCVYVGSRLDDLRVESAPLIRQSKHKQGYHLSDPCIASNSKYLFCFYRETIRLGLGKERNTIFAIRYSEDSKKWEEPIELFTSSDDAILSPAFIFDKRDNCLMYYVSRVNGLYTLKCRYFADSFNYIREREYVVDGVPEGYMLWHIAIVYKDTHDKHEVESSSLEGLFLVFNETSKNDLRLLDVVYDQETNIWRVNGEVNIPEQARDEVRFLYKSCFIPETKKVLLSYRDKKNRNRLIVN